MNYFQLRHYLKVDMLKKKERFNFNHTNHKPASSAATTLKINQHDNLNKVEQHADPKVLRKKKNEFFNNLEKLFCIVTYDPLLLLAGLQQTSVAFLILT